jgi:hypothetical protein
MIRRADDGPYFLHVLHLITVAFEEIADATKERARQQRLERYRDIAKQLQRRFDESGDTPRHFEKVKWFAKYWNDCVSESEWTGKGFERVHGPGLPTFFSSL